MLTRKRIITPLDGIILLLLLAGVGYAVHAGYAHLNYRWRWESIPQYLFRKDSESGQWVPNYLMQGLFTTLRLSFWGGGLATIFGIAMGLAGTSRSLFGRLVSRTYVELLRNLPPLVIIFIFYFFISDLILPTTGIEAFLVDAGPRLKQTISIFFAPPAHAVPFLSALVTLAVFEGAYITEIVRAGIESVEKGQWEAALALGLSRWYTLRHIILPQAIQRLLPALAGQLISLIKDSSIVSIISIQELAYQGTQLMASTYLTIETWVTVALMYLVLTLTLSLAVSRLEVRMARKL
jgi:polar amino acid transport system permease protein